MFEILYLSRIVKVLEEHPRETIAAVTILVVANTMASVKKEKAKAEVLKECELIRLETAKYEAMNRSSQ